MIPYSQHALNADDVAAVTAALHSGYLTSGPEVAAFEKALAEAVGSRHAVACANGTAALHLAALALQVGPGDGVIVPSVTFVASANAFRLAGAEIVFADVDPTTGLLTAETLRAALARVPAGLTAKAAVAVHLNGNCCDLAAITDVARQAGLWLVADSCHALGTRYHGRDGTISPVGAADYADLETFSFHPVKTIAMGEGGAVTTRDDALAERLTRLRNHGLTRAPEAFGEVEQAFEPDGSPKPWYYEMPEIGFNYRASDLQCALGRSQLGRLSQFVARRRELAHSYDAALASMAPTVQPPARPPWSESALHLYAVRIDFQAAGVSRSQVMHRLRAAGIGTQVHYIPVHWQPYYRQRYGALARPGAESYYAACLSLPLYVDLTREHVDQIAQAVASALAGRPPEPLAFEP